MTDIHMRLHALNKKVEAEGIGCEVRVVRVGVRGRVRVRVRVRVAVPYHEL